MRSHYLANLCDIVRACEASHAQLTQMASDLTVRRQDDSVHRMTNKSEKKVIALVRERDQKVLLKVQPRILLIAMVVDDSMERANVRLTI